MSTLNIFSVWIMAFFTLALLYENRAIVKECIVASERTPWPWLLRAGHTARHRSLVPALFTAVLVLL